MRASDLILQHLLEGEVIKGPWKPRAPGAEEEPANDRTGSIERIPMKPGIAVREMIQKYRLNQVPPVHNERAAWEGFVGNEMRVRISAYGDFYGVSIAFGEPYSHPKHGGPQTDRGAVFHASSDFETKSDLKKRYSGSTVPGRAIKGNKKIGTKWRIGGFLNSNGLSYEDRYVRINDIIGYAAKLRDRILGDDAAVDFNPETRDRLIGYGYERGTFVHSKAKRSPNPSTWIINDDGELEKFD